MIFWLSLYLAAYLVFVLGTGGESGLGAQQGSYALNLEDFWFNWPSRHIATGNASRLVSNDNERLYALLLYV